MGPPITTAAIHGPGHRALRRAVRGAHEGHEVLGDARSDGADRARRRDLARRRPARHLDVPARLLRVADEHGRRQFVRAGAAVRADRGARGGQALHRRGDARRGDGGRRGRAARHHRRPAGDRPGLQDAARPRRRRRLRSAHLPGRRPDVLRLPGRGRPGDDGPRRDAHRRARSHARRARALRPAPEVHLHGPELPQPGRRDAVARAPPRARPDRLRARAARARGQPVRPAPLRGRRRCRRCARSTRSSSSTRARSRRSSRPASASAGRRRRRRCWRR